MREPVNNQFTAVFNPFNLELKVKYGDSVMHYQFAARDGWVKISFNGDRDHPNYLHIQLDYDEELQLLFYPRRANDESLHENLGVYFHSMDMDKVPEQITLVYNDKDFKKKNL